MLSFPQISVSELELEIAMATDCKIVTYNKGLWVVSTAQHMKIGPAAHNASVFVLFLLVTPWNERHQKVESDNILPEIH